MAPQHMSASRRRAGRARPAAGHDHVLGAVAQLEVAVRVQALPGLGHFPMVEDPERLLGHLRPALARLRLS